MKLYSLYAVPGEFKDRTFVMAASIKTIQQHLKMPEPIITDEGPVVIFIDTEAEGMVGIWLVSEVFQPVADYLLPDGA